MKMFVNHINAKLDAKGRAVVPASYRKILAENVTLYGRMETTERYLTVYTEEAWQEKYMELRSRLDEFDERDNETLMQFTDETVEMTVDKQGRLLLPREQKERMGVESEITFAGMGDRFAIWKRERYEEMLRERTALKAPAKRRE